MFGEQKANKAFKPLAKLARTPSTPHRVAGGFAMFAQTVLRTGRRLTGRSSALRADERARVVPNIRFSARSAVEPSLERHPFRVASSSRTRVLAAHQRLTERLRSPVGRWVCSVRDDAQLASVSLETLCPNDRELLGLV